MIQQPRLTTIRPPSRMPVSPQRTAASPGLATASSQPSAKLLGSAARVAAPPESMWYRIKKAVIDFFSNINLGKRDVHGVTAAMAKQVLPQMQPGDILLRRTDGTSGNLFIPSWWKHAGVYVGNGEVVDAAFKGIGKDSLEAFMTGGDAIMIVRPRNLTPEQREAIASYAKAQVGKPYDFDFDFLDESRQSCTELANHAVKAGAGKELVEKNWFGAITGDGFKNENFTLIWSNVPEEAAF